MGRSHRQKLLKETARVRARGRARTRRAKKDTLSVHPCMTRRCMEPSWNGKEDMASFNRTTQLTTLWPRSTVESSFSRWTMSKTSWKALDLWSSTCFMRIPEVLGLRMLSRRLRNCGSSGFGYEREG